MAPATTKKKAAATATRKAAKKAAAAKKTAPATTKAKSAKKAVSVKKGGGATAKKRGAAAKKKDIPPAEIAARPAPEFITNERAAFVITGRPSTMHRPRFNPNKKERPHVFSPSASEANQLRQKLQRLVKQNELPEDQATLFEKKAKLSFEADFMLCPRPGRRPDLDNLLKFVLDALNKSVWHDDGQVREVRIRLLTNASPEGERTVVSVAKSDL